MPLPTMLTETSNNSVSAPQRDSPDVKAANKERQTIIPTVSLVSCCCTEIVACMCKQSTPEKLHNKQFKAVVRMLRHDAHRPTAGWTAICWVDMVSDCQVLPFQCMCLRKREGVWVLRQNMTPVFLRQQPTHLFYGSLLALKKIVWSWKFLWSWRNQQFFFNMITDACIFIADHYHLLLSCNPATSAWPWFAYLWSNVSSSSKLVFHSPYLGVKNHVTIRPEESETPAQKSKVQKSENEHDTE